MFNQQALEQKEKMIGNAVKRDMCSLALGILSGKQFLDMKEETHGQIEFSQKMEWTYSIILISPCQPYVALTWI